MSKALSEMSNCELVDEVVKLQQRNAELAAHVERWHDVYVDLTNNMVMFDGVSHYVADNAMMRRFDEIDESAPTTSLARLKAQAGAEARKQVTQEWELALPRLKAQAKAEAFENLANYEGHWTQRDMEAIASDYRRQAEEPAQ